MRHDDLADQTATAQQETGDNLSLVLRALPLLLSDLCLIRFEALVQAGVDPLEAAQHALNTLSRYDFLSGLEPPGTGYPALKKQIENTISTEAGRVIEEQNPR